MIGTKKLKPFDEAAALRGDPVYTWYGQLITQLKKFDTDPEFCNWAGVLEGSIELFHASELHMAPKVREVWVRVMVNSDRTIYKVSTRAGKDAENELNSNNTYSWIGPAVKAGEIEE